MNRTIIMEADAKDAKILSTLIKEQALKDISEDEYKQHIRIVCGREVLDYAKSLVINLPGTCYANCSYCIDKDLRPCTTDHLSFLQTCRACCPISLISRKFRSQVGHYHQRNSTC